MLKKLTTWIAPMVAVVTIALSSAPALAQSRDLSAIVDSGVLRVGLISQPPFARYDTAARSWSGPSYEIAKLMASAMEVELEIVESNYQNIIPGLQAEKTDIALSPVYATPKRAMAIWFTEPYRYERSGLLMRKDDVGKYATIEDLDSPDVTIVANLGSASETDARRYFPKANVKGVPADGLMLEVQAGRATAWYADMTTVDVASQRNPEWAAVWNQDYVFNAVPMAFMIRRGDIDLLYFLNTSLNYYITQGVIQNIDRAGGLIDSKRSRSDH